MEGIRSQKHQADSRRFLLAQLPKDYPAMRIFDRALVN
jgi:hypothetical protein